MRWIPLVLVLGCGGDPEGASGPQWQVDGLQLVETVSNQVLLTGTITLVSGDGSAGTSAAASFYKDEYVVEAGAFHGTIGAGAEAGVAQDFEVSAIQSRLEPHEDGFPMICVELEVAGSNLATPTQVGCLEATIPEPTTTDTTPAPEAPPTAEITSPLPLELFGPGEPVDLEGQVDDPNQSDDSLQIRWTWEPADGGVATEITDIDGTTWDGWTRGTWADAALGDWRIRLVVTDLAGNEASDEVVISVVDRQLADLDGDGFTPYGGDCDDSDAAISPGIAEACDGIDHDCSGVAWDKDEDGDGHVDEACTGYVGPKPIDDCDDAEPLAWTGHPEVPGDGVDNDCDGYGS